MPDPDVRPRFDEDGFVVLPAYLPPGDVDRAAAELPLLFPTADEFHDDVDPARNERFRDEFGGIVDFPFASAELSVLAVHPRLVDLAEELTGADDMRAYSIEAWAKYTGAADYDQAHHRDYLNHSLVVPAPGQPPVQVEMFVYLVDVPAALGPPSLVPRRHVADLPALPNWYPRQGSAGAAAPGDWVCADGSSHLYEVEVSAAGPAGTVVAYRIETFHRGTALRAPRGARFTLHVNLRRADAGWITRRGWGDAAATPAWASFVACASPRQLELFGVPPPGHPYWTPETLAGMALRYPGLDTSAWA